MEKLSKEYLQQLLGEIECQKGIKCVDSNPEEICKARDFGSESFLICMEEDPDCSFALSFGYGYMCQCPARIYIAKTYRF